MSPPPDFEIYFTLGEHIRCRYRSATATASRLGRMLVIQRLVAFDFCGKSALAERCFSMEAVDSTQGPITVL